MRPVHRAPGETGMGPWLGLERESWKLASSFVLLSRALQILEVPGMKVEKAQSLVHRNIDASNQAAIEHLN